MKQIICIIYIIGFWSLLGCKNTLSYTPKEYKNSIKIGNDLYIKDSLSLIEQLGVNLRDKGNSFYTDYIPIDYELSIDTIMYNVNKNKMALLVILGYSTDKWEEKDGQMAVTGKKYVFNGYGFLAKRNNQSYKLHKMVHIISNFTNKKEASAYLYNIYFHQLATLQEPNYRYNFDDTRLWDEPIWHKL